jgi:hypothetical protein
MIKSFFELCKVHWKQIIGYSIVIHLLLHEIPMILFWLYTFFILS